MKNRAFPILTVSVYMIVMLSSASLSFALEVNENGRDLIHQAAKAYNDDMRDRPVITDKGFVSYINGVVKRLVISGKKSPAGVRVNATILESPIPEVYSYVDGHIVITSGSVFAVDNEAQLATLLSHEVAHLVEGHYIGMYQQIKAAERKQKWKAATGAIFGVLLDSTVDYVTEVESAKQSDKLWKGEATYLSTAKSVAKISAAQSAYYGIKDVIANIPARDDGGGMIDPRQRFEVVADAQGMEYLALAGYDVNEAPKAWDKLRRVKSKRAMEKEKAMGPWAAQMRQTESMMRMLSGRMRQSLGESGLVQTISDAPPSRPGLVGDFVNLKEVRAAQKKGRERKGIDAYRRFLKHVLMPRAERELADEDYSRAEADFSALYDKGIRQPAVIYGLAKSSIGDFAFSATIAQKRKAEKLYLKAARANRKYAMPYKGLGELYEDWERYGDAANAYSNYLKRAPKAFDAAKIRRKIGRLKRKAAR
ncbi:peptidase family M48 [bacterium BMS3Abin07]|nr:peptidase family M48 [bacterium BMS3Abin07]HDL20059.1 hypothetical protein [Nitrospirota bacterium]HDO23311.1 hypothetical protein [Nitrospirota bacterium]HDZ88668.1 hypothetical protein [Nitrospirota bacterium]